MVKCKPYVVEATPELVDRMLGHLRHADDVESRAMCGYSADWALKTGLRFSEKCWVGMDGETPVACFGVKSAGLLSETGTPWLLGTDKVLDVQREFIRQSRSYVRKMAEGFKMLENWVDARNTVSVRWLRWCGFNMEAMPRPFGVNGELFHRFWIGGL